MKKQDVLIIKTGYSEILDSQDSNKSSLGDVLRTTPILNLYKNDNVTWVTDIEALPLLEKNPYIKKLLPLDFITIIHLLENEFDTVINLEKNLNICKLSNMITAWKKYGFRYDKKTGRAEAYDRASEILFVGSDIDKKRNNKRTFQELLFEMVGEKWEGED
jgi:heptosyltransferase II